jgi:predicted exporter
VSARVRRFSLLIAWVIVLIAAALFVQRTLKVGTDLRSFMPPAQTADQKLLMEQIGEGPGSRLLLLAISGADDESLAALSRALVDALRTDEHFTQVVNGAFDSSSLDESLLPYRYLLTPSFDQQPMNAEMLADELSQRVEDLGSPAASLLKPILPRDPTVEIMKLADRWSPPKAPIVREGVWFSAENEALLLVQTKAPGFDPTAQGGAIALIESRFAESKQALAASGEHVSAQDAQLVMSGPGYFSVLVNAKTRGESEWLGRISTVGFIVLLLLAYRSIAVLGLAALPIASGALAGVASIAAMFGEMHGITLAFGFTLLGVAQEYPIRVLSHRRAGETAVESVRSLWPLLLTAIASACIAYLAFFASGVTGLMQLAVFTISGLLVAGLTTRYLLPRVLPERFRDAADTPGLGRIWDWLESLPRPRWLPAVLTVIAGIMLWTAPTPLWENNLAALTPVPQDLMLREARLRGALGAPDVRYMLILEADSAEGVIALSERVTPSIDRIVELGAIDAAELPSRYLPSVATQRERQAKLPTRDVLAPMLDQALEELPFRSGLFEPFLDDIETARNATPLTPAMFASSPLGARIEAMLIEREGHWLGLGTVIGMHDPTAFDALAAETNGAVRLLDLKGASESLVASYRERIMQAFAIAVVLLVLTVFVAFRDLRRAWHVLAPMTLATILVLAVLRFGGVSLSLFHLVALTLAAGLGLHYALFFERTTPDAAEARRTLHATLVCVISALLVFALLAWSSLPVLRAIGLTVSLGVGFHFCLSILMARKGNSKHV